MKNRNLASILIVICFFLSGCADSIHQNELVTECEYEVIEDCGMKDVIINYCVPYCVFDLIVNNSVKVLNQEATISGYELKLDEYFINENTGTVVYKMLIMDENGGILTDEQMEELRDMLERGELYAQLDRSAGDFVDQIIKRDENNQVAWYIGNLISAISDDSYVSDVDISPKKLNCVDVYVGFDNSVKFYLPSYEYEEKVIIFDVSESDTLLYAKMTSSGMCIVWNITTILKKYKNATDSLSDEETESLGYKVYNDIRINMTNGDTFNISKSNAYIEEETREDNCISGFSAIWEGTIDLDEVENLEIDGEKYFVK